MSQTTIAIERDQIKDMNTAAKDLFGTSEVPHRVTLERLMESHPDVGDDDAE